MSTATLNPTAVSAARRKAGWSQERLAAAIGVSRATLQNTEAGRSIPRADVLANIARTLGVPMDSLFTDHIPEADTASAGCGTKPPRTSPGSDDRPGPSPEV
jgi:transcriptional regulator with XRE-family HTH domain